MELRLQRQVHKASRSTASVLAHVGYMDTGQATLEFVLLAPLMILILMAVIQFGLLFSMKQQMMYATRESARVASTFRGPDSERIASAQAVAARMCTRCPGDGISIAIEGDWPRRTVVAEFEYDMPLMVPVINRLLGAYDPFPLRTFIIVPIEE